MKTTHNLLLSLTAGFLLSSCEYHFKISSPETEAKMMLEFVSGHQNDSCFFSLRKLVPIGQEPSMQSDYEIEHISLLANGEIIDIEEDLDFLSPIYYKCKVPNIASTKLELSFKAKGIDEISAHTTIPQKPEFDISILSYDEECCNCKLTIPAEKLFGHYALLAFFECNTLSSSCEEYDGRYWVRENIEAMEGQSIFQVQTFRFVNWKDHYKSKNYYVIDDSALETGEINFKLTHSVYGPDFLNNCLFKLYRMSDETYYYFNALYNAQNNALDNFNFLPSNCAYTNVRNGAGIMGSMASGEIIKTLPTRK